MRNEYKLIDEQSIQKGKQLFDAGAIDHIEVDTRMALKQSTNIFSKGLSVCRQIREQNISKGGFKFANALSLWDNQKKIEESLESDYEEIVAKYIEMNIVHLFMEGNGRSMRVWLDLMLKKNLWKCVKWQNIDKYGYISAMESSVSTVRK